MVIYKNYDFIKILNFNVGLFFTKFKEDLGFEKYAFLYNYWVPDVLDVYDEYFNFNVDC